MPLKNGLDFLRELKAKDVNLPFILFTGRGREEIAIQALNLGADGYFNKQGNPETVYGELAHGIKTIFERRKTKIALAESEKRCQMLMQQAPEMIFIHDSKGRFVYVNPQACKNLGYTAEELYRIRVVDVDSNAREDSLAALWPKVLAGETFTFETTHKRKDGTIYPAEVSISAISIEEQNLIMGFARNISERRKIEEKLKESEEKYRSIVDLSPDGIAVASLRGKILMVNKAFLDLTGFSEDEIVGKHFTKLGTLRPSEMPKYVKLFMNILRSKKPAPFEFVYLKKDGRLRDAEAHVALLKRNGKKIGFQAILRDITERKMQDKELRDSEEKFAKAFNYASNALIITSISDGRIIDANDSLSALLGYSTDELIGKTTIELGIWVEIEDRQKIVNEVATKDFVQNREVLLRRKDKSIINAIGSMSRINIKNESLLLSSLIDISELKKTEAKLRDSETRYRLLAENSKDVIWSMDLDGNFTYVSPSVFQLRGYTAEETMRQSMAEVVTPESAETIFEALQKFRETGEIPKKYFELEAPCKDGSKIWIEASFSIFKGKDGKPETIFGASRDITERKKAEEEIKKSQRQLEIANKKLQVVGSLTRHDVGNKLMTAKSNLYLLKKSVNDPVLTNYIESIQEELDQSNRLFEFSSLYEKIGAEKPKDTNVANCFDEAIKLLPQSSIEFVNKTQGLVVLADSLFRQFFYNLIDNSLKHGKTVSRIQLSFTQNDKKTTLIYEDNGVGIPVEDKERIFLGNFTTGNGSGLGLKLAAKLVEAYGWSIKESGVYGKGAKFVITIPQQ
jgi:PAS domain S-box-containing protein